MTNTIRETRSPIHFSSSDDLIDWPAQQLGHGSHVGSLTPRPSSKQQYRGLNPQTQKKVDGAMR